MMMRMPVLPEPERDDDDEEVSEHSTPIMPSYGYVQINLRLVEAPTPQFNKFDAVLLAN